MTLRNKHAAETASDSQSIFIPVSMEVLVNNYNLQLHVYMHYNLHRQIHGHHSTALLCIQTTLINNKTII